ncbi:MAG: methyltransferase domain-containing protein [Pseudomonadota bacterium]
MADTPAQPCEVLQSNAHLLPAAGKALDLAAGSGGNALFLARHGLETEAWDISSVAMERLATAAATAGLTIGTGIRDIINNPPQAQQFDVIVVCRFLHRPLCPQITDALRPGGLLFYQTFLSNRINPQIGPRNPAYLLQRNELLRLFSSLKVVAYREEGVLAGRTGIFGNEACLVAQKA